MADQDDSSGFGLAKSPGEDNSSFGSRIADRLTRDALVASPGALPIAQAARAVARRFGLAKAPGEN